MTIRRLISDQSWHQLFVMILVVNVSSSLLVQAPSWAEGKGRQRREARKPAQAAVEPVVTQDELAFDEDGAPPPEPPYPGSENSPYAADPSLIAPAEETEDLPITPRPLRIDAEGNYLYGTEIAAPSVTSPTEITRPKAFTKSGDFLYETRPEPSQFSGNPEAEAPLSITASGEYRYKLESSPQRAAVSFRIGAASPPDLKNADNGLLFTNVYGNAPVPVLLGDYEWPLFATPIGKLSIKGGSGLMVTNGQGRFKRIERLSENPDERFTFVMFPNTLTANYKFQFSRKQVLVPFVEGGAGYFVFAEIRDDAKKPKFGAAPVGVLAGGVNFLLDWIDPHAIRQLDNEYGINHVWLTAEVRANVGLHSSLDFTSNSVNAGFLMEY